MWYDYQADDNKRCPKCGKPLPKRVDWGYRMDGKDYCSNKCYQAADRDYKASREYQEILTQLGGQYALTAPIRVRRNAEISEEEMAEWARMIRAGETVANIAKAFNRSYDVVHYHLSRVGLNPPRCNKLTYKQADDIRTRAKNGARPIDLALEYRVSKETINRIIRGDTYNEHQ